MRLKFPSSRGSLRVRFSLFDVLWAALAPFLALYFRDAYILSSKFILSPQGAEIVVLYCGLSLRKPPVVVYKRPARATCAAANIILIIAKRVRDGFSDIRVGGEVHHRGRPVPFKHIVKSHYVAYIAFLERPPLYRPIVSTRQVVIDNRLVPLLSQCFAGVAANISCTPSD